MTDVVVVGAGGSGLAAAARAAERGARVIVLEKQPSPGGTTAIAVGSFTASETSWQRLASIDDSVAAHAEDASKFAPEAIESRNDDSLRSHFLRDHAETLDWLASLGLGFHGPNPEPPNRVPRMHNVVPGARAYILALQRELSRHGGELRCGHDVLELWREDDRVVGVRGRSDSGPFSLRARAGVVLAAGDYANSRELIARFKGERFASVEGINTNALGDGHLLAESVGAKLVNMDVTYGPELRFVPPRRAGLLERLAAAGGGARWLGRIAPFLPRSLLNAFVKRRLVTWQHPEDALLADGAILVNARGERFGDGLPSPERELVVAEQPGGVAYILLDRKLATRYSAWPHFVSTAPEIAYAYVDDYLRLRPDVARRSDSLAALAATAGFSLDALRQAVASLTESSVGDEAGEDPRAGAAEDDDRGPWTCLGPVKAYFTTTEGGVAINRDFEALDEQGKPIPGLHAVGQNGLGGQILWGHGLHIAWAITSGRRVGELLAERAKRKE